MRPTHASQTTSPLRAAALLVLGALALHELRYLIDPSAGSTIWSGEHAYLSAATPILVALALSIAAVTLFAPLLRRRRALTVPGAGRAGVYAAALLAVHLGQETAEGLIAGALPGELAVSLLAAAAFAIPLALALGGLASLVAGWLERTERRVVAALGARVRAGSPPRGSAVKPFIVPARERLEAARPPARGPPPAPGAAL